MWRASCIAYMSDWSPGVSPVSQIYEYHCHSHTWQSIGKSYWSSDPSIEFPGIAPWGCVEMLFSCTSTPANLWLLNGGYLSSLGFCSGFTATGSCGWEPRGVDSEEPSRWPWELLSATETSTDPEKEMRCLWGTELLFWFGACWLLSALVLLSVLWEQESPRESPMTTANGL